ncbi:hypothetical protein AVEN_142598-1, partial [Araneus ventricosus]
ITASSGRFKRDEYDGGYSEAPSVWSINDTGASARRTFEECSYLLKPLADVQT